jgi:hypothetical protein
VIEYFSKTEQVSPLSTTGRHAAVGGRLFSPPDVTNAASISGQSMPSGLALHRATMAPSRAAPNAPKKGT